MLNHNAIVVTSNSTLIESFGCAANISRSIVNCISKDDWLLYANCYPVFKLPPMLASLRTALTVGITFEIKQMGICIAVCS